MENEQILKKISDVADGIKFVQDKCDSLEKKHDALDYANKEDVATASAKAFEEIQELKVKIGAEDLVEKLFAIEKAVTEFKGSKEEETSDEHKKAFYAYLRKGTPLPSEVVDDFCRRNAKKSLVNADDEKLASYTKDLREGSNPDGGFFVTPERSASIITRIFETSPVRSVASLMTTASNSVEIILDDDEAAANRVDEVSASTTTDTPEVGLVTIPLHVYDANPRITQMMLDDAGFDIEGWLQGKVSRKISRMENTDFVLGDGSKKAKGFLAYPDWAVAGTYERDAIEQIDGTTAGVLTEPNDLINLQDSLIEEYQAGSAERVNRQGSAWQTCCDYGRYACNRKRFPVNCLR